jgi:predicted DNA-binding protein
MSVSPTVGVRIPSDLRQRAEDQAQREDRSLSQLIRRALTEHIDPVSECGCAEPVVDEDEATLCLRCHRPIRSSTA